MKTRLIAATKFRSIQIPRTQNGWMTENKNSYKQRLMSARNFSQINPQQKRIDQKCYHNKSKYNSLIEKKIDLGKMETAAHTTRDQIVFKPQKTKQQYQQNSYGRNLQYPYTKPINIRPQTSDSAKKRAVTIDYQSKHLADKTIKSKKAIQIRQKFQQKYTKAFKYLVRHNKNYLWQHSRICNQRARPKEEIFKINYAPTLNTYKDHYPPKQAKYQFSIQPQNQKHAFSLPQGKVCGNSLNQEAHNGRQGPRADLQSWPEGFKLQGPLASTTSYINQFPNNGDFEKMIPIAIFNEHVRGMPHKTNSTNRDHFRGQSGKQSQAATWNNLHPFGNQFNPDRGSHYASTHNKKEKQSTQQWPMYDPKLIVTDGKFSTQYRQKMSDQMQHQLNQPNYCNCDRCKRIKNARNKIRH